MTNIRTDIDQLLGQMRQLQLQAQGQTQDVSLSRSSITEGNNTQEAGFGEMLKNAVDGVNQQQAESSQLQQAYEQGVEGVDLTQVMISMQKASLSFEAMKQVRNRLVSAYEDIMNMSV